MKWQQPCVYYWQLRTPSRCYVTIEHVQGRGYLWAVNWRHEVDAIDASVTGYSPSLLVAKQCIAYWGPRIFEEDVWHGICKVNY